MRSTITEILRNSSSGNQLIYQFNNWGNTISIQDGEGRAQFARWAKDENADTGKGNQIKLASKLQNTVANTIKDGPFENNTLWNYNSTQTTCSISTDDAYIGNKSMYMSATSDTHVVSNTTTVDPGESFTFSAYVKVVSGTFRLAISDRVKISILAYGEVVPVSNEWTRYEVSVTNNTTETMTVAPTLRLLAGTQVYIDCAQGELAATASRVNLITNGDFRFVASNPPFTWAATGLDSAVDKAVAVEKSAAPELDVNAFSITGSPTKKKRLATVVAVNGSEGDTLILSGWAKGNAAPDDMEGMEPDGTVNDRVFGLVATINYTDGSTEKVTATFNPDVENWQYTATPIVPQKAYTSVKVELTYDYNVNTVLFDGIQLYKEEFGSSYTYDDEGNVISVVDLQKKETTYEYDTSGNLTKVMQDNKAKMTYTYDDYHNVETATSAEGLAYSFVYDTYGNKTVKISYR